MDPNRSNVKRALFPVDHDALQRDLDREMQELEREEVQRMRATYNFNPKSGKPLEGQWEWEAINPKQKDEIQSNPVDTEIQAQDSTLEDKTPTQPPQTPEKT